MNGTPRQMDGKYYVYIHRTKTDGRIFYVGKGSGYRRSNANPSTHSPQWVAIAYKEGFTWEIISHWIDSKDAFAAEAELCATLKDLGHPLVNMNTGTKMADEQKQFLSNLKTGVSRKQGPWTEAHRESHRQAMKKAVETKRRKRAQAALSTSPGEY